jgi:hypothetical protein
VCITDVTKILKCEKASAIRLEAESESEKELIPTAVSV